MMTLKGCATFLSYFITNCISKKLELLNKQTIGLVLNDNNRMYKTLFKNKLVSLNDRILKMLTLVYKFLYEQTSVISNYLIP